jgi:hypothetical protein
MSPISPIPDDGQKSPRVGMGDEKFSSISILDFYRPIAFGASGAIENGVEIVRVVSGYQDLTMLFAEDDE